MKIGLFVLTLTFSALGLVTAGWVCRIDNITDWMAMRVAWLLPRRVAYWALIRIAAAVSCSPSHQANNLPELTIMEVAAHWRRAA